jgi:uncharacterized membrane protein
METHLRSIAKAVSYRITGTVITFLIAWWITGTIDLAAKVGLIDPVAKIAIFYLHERFWHRVDFGRLKHPEYEI